MGARALNEPGLSRSAVAGAVLSTVATIIELLIVVAATSRPTLYALRIPALFAGSVIVAYGVLFTLRTMHYEVPETINNGRAFSLRTAVGFALAIAVMLLASAALNTWFGARGVIAAAAVAGFADAHSVAVSVASLVASGKLSPHDSVIPVLAGLTTNTLAKMVVAAFSGGRRFALQVIPGLVLFLTAAWLSVLYR